MTTTSHIYGPLIALAAAFVAAPLAAQDGTTVEGRYEPLPQEVVSFADLDLRNWSHQQALKGRVHKASERVCIRAEGPIEYNMLGFAGTPSCTDLTYRDARPQIRAAIDRAKFGQQMAMSLVVSGPARTR